MSIPPITPFSLIQCCVFFTINKMYQRYRWLILKGKRNYNLTLKTVNEKTYFHYLSRNEDQLDKMKASL